MEKGKSTSLCYLDKKMFVLLHFYETLCMLCLGRHN